MKVWEEDVVAAMFRPLEVGDVEEEEQRKRRNESQMASLLSSKGRTDMLFRSPIKCWNDGIITDALCKTLPKGFLFFLFLCVKLYCFISSLPHLPTATDRQRHTYTQTFYRINVLLNPKPSACMHISACVFSLFSSLILLFFFSVGDLWDFQSVHRNHTRQKAS